MVSATNRLRIVSVISLVLGGLQFIFGVTVFNVVSSDPFGAWWAGLMVVITSIIGFFGTSHCRMATAMGFSIPAIVMCIAGTVLDGAGYAFIRKLHACANEDLDAYGDNDYKLTAQACVVTNEGHDCACVMEKFDADDDTDCYLFDLHEGDNCGHILDLPPNLQASYVLCLCCALAMIIYSIITCGTVCCPAKCCGYANEAEKSTGTTTITATTHAVLHEPIYTPSAHLVADTKPATSSTAPTRMFYGQASASSNGV